MQRNFGQGLKEKVRTHLYEFWVPLGLRAMNGMALLEMPLALLELIAHPSGGDDRKCPSCASGASYNYGGKQYYFCLICGKRFSTTVGARNYSESK
jgi:hypothetical protein